MRSNTQGSTFQAVILLILAVIVLGVGGLLYANRLSTRPSSPSAGDETSASYAEAEQKAQASWQSKIGDAQSQLLVLQSENERLKGKDQ